MDLKRYKKTRYQNIYKNIRGGNYIIIIPGTKHTVSYDDYNNKIYDIETAKSIRDDKKIKQLKISENKLNFDSLWDEYIKFCEDIKRQEYNTIIKKQRLYNKYFKNKFYRISEINKYIITEFLNNLNCSLKQKNEIIKVLRAFFNWCIEENKLIVSPIKGIHNYKVNKNTMKFWTTSEFESFLSAIDKDLHSESIFIRRKANLIRILALIGINIGDRIGESRALTWSDIDQNKMVINIRHSINYKPKRLFKSDENYLGNTKNYHSQREVDVSLKLINELFKYKDFLKNEYGSVNDIIFYNYEYKAPYSSVTLRKYFNEYCDKAKVSKIRMYDLRHTYVAIMMEEEWELYHISLRLGHSSYSTTVNKYGHLSNNVKKRLAETTDKYY